MSDEIKMVSRRDLESPDSHTRLLAARAVGEGAQLTTDRMVMSDESSAGLLTPVLREDAEPMVRAEAAWALGERGDTGGIEILGVALTSDTDEFVRATAARALSKQGGRQSQEALEQALKRETAAKVRMEIVRALGRITGQPPRPTMGVETDDLHETLRQIAERDEDPALRLMARAQLER